MLRILALTIILAISAVSFAFADGYPQKPTQVVVPWKPGGGSDISARIVNEPMKEILGQPFVISNIDGAAGLNGANTVYRARPDGYTLLWEHVGNLAVGPMITKAPYTWRDFKLVCAVGQSDIVLIARANSPWKDTADAIKDIKANPGKIRWAMGINAVSHLTYLSIAETAGGLNAMAIPAQGDKGRIVSILGNNSDISTVGYAAAEPYVKSGDIKVLGMATKERSPFAKDIPTLKEQGFDAGNVYLYSVFAPKDTPQEVLDKLEAAYEKSLADPKVQEALKKQSILPNFLNAEEAMKNWETEAGLYERLSKKNNLIK